MQEVCTRFFVLDSFTDVIHPDYSKDTFPLVGLSIYRI